MEKISSRSFSVKKGKTRNEKIFKERGDFIYKEIFPKIGLKELTDDIEDVVEYMFNGIEGSLCNDEESGVKLNDKEKELLRLATKTITERTPSTNC